MPMEVRLAGRVTDRRAEHSQKAPRPMEVRPAGKLTETRGAAGKGVFADGDEAARAVDRDEGGEVAEREVRQARHTLRKHRVPVGDDDLPFTITIVYQQGLGTAAGWRHQRAAVRVGTRQSLDPSSEPPK